MTSRILLVEDEPAISQAVAYTLKSTGYEVDVLEDGEQALRRFADYDLLLLDVMLPGLSGVEVCRRIRAQSAVPIMMVTAKDTLFCANILPRRQRSACLASAPQKLASPSDISVRLSQ